MTQRPIKFRAWDKRDNSMVSLDDLNVGEWVRDAETKEDCVVMQFTGLHDKNGKEIWEGDMFIDADGDKNVVEWEERSKEAGFFFGDNKTHHHIEVIGNIYENPELIKSL